MNYTIIGLGNPGTEYVDTRHNAGRIVTDMICREYEGGEFVNDKISKSLLSTIKIGSKKVDLVLPETFMNKSGETVKKFVKSAKDLEKLIVIYDDFQLPLGRVKMSFNKSSGGHRGLESIIKCLKSEAFTRIRVGTAPADSKGNAKIPHGEEKVEKFILGKFKPEEIKSIKKLGKKISETVKIFVEKGRDIATGQCNTD
jgi:PTH1 family peptidyl-tRNA hydrolase